MQRVICWIGLLWAVAGISFLAYDWWKTANGGDDLSVDSKRSIVVSEDVSEPVVDPVNRDIQEAINSLLAVNEFSESQQPSTHANEQ